MAAGDIVSIVHKKDSFSHTDACRIFDLAVRTSGAKTVVIDLKNASDATTSAFAKLVLLRRTLLHQGRDLVLAGLRDRTATVYHINRLNLVLPAE
jgi:anti-anti-sigma regulatory factor